MKTIEKIQNHKFYKLTVYLILCSYLFITNSVYALPESPVHYKPAMNTINSYKQMGNETLNETLAPASYLIEPQKTFPKEYLIVSEFINWFLSFNVLSSTGSIQDALIAGTILRIFFFAGIYFNELGHMIAAKIKNISNVFSKDNIKGNVSPIQWLGSLFPLINILIFKNLPHIKVNLKDKIESLDKVDKYINKKGFITGVIIHISLAVSLIALSYLFMPYLLTSGLILFIGISFSLTTAMAFLSDFKRPAKLKGKYFCGLFGMFTFKELDYKKFLDVLHKSISYTEVRGKQAGGIFFISNSLSFLKKIINSKRGTLAKKLLNVMSEKKGLENSVTGEKEVIVQGHVRFGTSSPPSIEATHPHIYSDSLKYTFNAWHINNGEWTSNAITPKNSVTHNGDYSRHDLRKHFRFAREKDLNSLEVDRLGLNGWLQNTVGLNDAPGDSVNISGMLDLFHTQGMWIPSIRLAWYKHMAEDISDFIELENIRQLAFTMDREFHSIVEKTTDKSAMEELCKNALRNYLQDSAFDWINNDYLEDFVESSVKGFFDNDMYNAVKEFSEGAIGTFAINFSSNHPNKKTICYANGQPLAVAVSKEGDFVQWLSEPAGAKIRNSETSEPIYSYRIVLDDVGGEIMEIGTKDEKPAFKVYSKSNKREFSSIVDYYQTGRIESLIDNPLISEIPDSKNNDPVDQDINDIRETLYDISLSFSDNHKDTNSLTAKDFSEKIGEKLLNPNDKELDVVIIAEETSLFHAQSFSSIIGSSISENLKIRAFRSNDILGGDKNINNKTISINNDKGSDCVIGENTLVLALSQSGQTFSTAKATSLLSYMCKDTFVLTGEYDSEMGRAVGQKYYKGAKPVNRIFTNKSGYRPSEVSTVSSIATTQTLTEILIYMVKHLSSNKAYEKLITLKTEDVNRLRLANNNFINKTVKSILEPKNPVMENIKNKGRLWGDYILESAWVWILVKGLVLLSVGLQIYPVYALLAVYFIGAVIQSISFTKNENLRKNKLFKLLFPRPSSKGTLIFSWVSVFLLAGISFFVFANILPVVNPWVIGLIYCILSEVFTFVLRLIKNRPLLDRIFGTRSVVISDSSNIYKLLHSLGTKLFSSAYELATVNFQSAKTNNFPHFFAHQVTRGSLTWIGLGRKAPFLYNDYWANSMNSKQTLGIQNFKSGARLITLGHDDLETIDNNHQHINIKPVKFEFPAEKIIKRLNEEFHLTPKQSEILSRELDEDYLMIQYNKWSSLDRIANEITNKIFGEEQVDFYNSILKILNKEMVMEKIIDSRFDSQLRYLAGIVFFDSMSQKVSKHPIIRFILPFARWISHNGTRTQTTASPQPADHVMALINELEKKRQKNLDPAQKMLIPKESIPQDIQDFMKIKSDALEAEIIETVLPSETDLKEIIVPDNIEAVDEISKTDKITSLPFTENTKLELENKAEAKIIKPSKTADFKDSVNPQFLEYINPENKDLLELIYKKCITTSGNKMPDWSTVLKRYRRELLKVETDKAKREEYFQFLLFRTAITPKYRKNFLNYIKTKRTVYFPFLTEKLDTLKNTESELINSCAKDNDSLNDFIKKFSSLNHSALKTDYKTINRILSFVTKYKIKIAAEKKSSLKKLYNFELLEKYKEVAGRRNGDWGGYLAYQLLHKSYTPEIESLEKIHKNLIIAKAA